MAAPDVSSAPWAIAAKEHQAAVTRWRASARQAKDLPQSIPTQAWLIYQLRFLIAADLAGAWLGFGGLAAQLNHLAIVMNISIVDSASVALSYDRLVREFLAERARSRREITGDTFFSDFLSVENPASKLRDTAEHPRDVAAPKGAPKEVAKEKKFPETAQPRSKPRSRSRSHQRSDRKPGRRSLSRRRGRRGRSPGRKDSPKKKDMEKR